MLVIVSLAQDRIAIQLILMHHDTGLRTNIV